MTKKKKKYLIIGLVIVAVAVVIGNVATTGKKTTKVQAEGVNVMDITEEVSASGYIHPQSKVNITAEVTAEIIEIPVVEGQWIEKGRLLVLLDTVQLQKDVDQYHYSFNEIEARTSSSQVLCDQAEEEYQRQERLFAKGLTSERVFKDAEYSNINSKYNYEAMLNQTKQAKARYEKALDNLSKTRVVAPMSGIITYLDAEVGEIASAQTPYTSGKTLMTISNMSAFEVEVDVDETEIIKIKHGQEGKVEIDAFPDTVFAGEVVEIGNTAVRTGIGSQDQSTNFKVKVLLLENNDKIRPGMSATVDIITNVKTDALSVPYGAIVMRSLSADSLARVLDTGGLVSTAHAASTDSDTSAFSEESEKEKEKEKEKKDVKGVFIMENDVAKFIPVETGIADQKNIEIVSGLTESDTVITGPFRTLRTIKNGDQVEMEKKPKSGEK